ncbi:MAG TPA: SMC-Scp complex subunit ScpB [Thermoplasmata archaeon]|nr:SMC-Scp complex subunit ScpB [Thermoplasmata archaeon]
MEVDKIVEAILFVASRPVGVEEIVKAGIKKKNLRKAINELKKRYENSSIEIVEIDGKYVMQIRSEFAEHVKKFAPMNISKSVLKTLAIIAYHQPVKQSEMKRIVGSQIYEHVRELKKKGFIKTRKEGRTKMIELTPYFYDYFGFDKKNKEKMKEILYSKIFNEEDQVVKS